MPHMPVISTKGWKTRSMEVRRRIPASIVPWLSKICKQFATQAQQEKGKRWHPHIRSHIHGR